MEDSIASESPVSAVCEVAPLGMLPLGFIDIGLGGTGGGGRLPATRFAEEVFEDEEEEEDDEENVSLFEESASCCCWSWSVFRCEDRSALGGKGLGDFDGTLLESLPTDFRIELRTRDLDAADVVAVSTGEGEDKEDRKGGVEKGIASRGGGANGGLIQLVSSSSVCLSVLLAVEVEVV